jgi:hypothetical protein
MCAHKRLSLNTKQNSSGGSSHCARLGRTALCVRLLHPLLASDAFTYVYSKALLKALDLMQEEFDDGKDTRDTY